MLRIFVIIFLSVGTLVTAGAWYCQLFAPVGGGLQVTRSMRIAYAVFDCTIAAQVSWKGGIAPANPNMTATYYELPGTPITATVATMRHSDGSRVQLWIVRSPIWFPTVIVVASWVAFELVSRRNKRRSRKKRGLCVNCGYDLTGNESGVCPECGTTTAAT